MDKKAFGIPLSDIITQVIYQMYGLHELTLAERVELNNFIDETLFQLTRSTNTCALDKLQPKVRELLERLKEQYEKERHETSEVPGLFRFTGMSDQYKQKAILGITCIAELIEEELTNASSGALH